MLAAERGPHMPTSLMPSVLLALGLGVLGVPATALAQSGSSSSDSSMEGMDMRPAATMPGHQPTSMPGNDPLLASGTSWHPASSPEPMDMWRVGDWTLMAHGRAQLGYNHQGSLRGGDAQAAENWGMLMAERPLGFGQLLLRSMVSLEPATVPPSGEPQLFQTGETYQGQPLIDRQHQHNLFMELAAQYTIPLSNDTSFFLYGGPVGEPALGPDAYMHRASAGENAWAPLGHHEQDSTHITNGVLTEGLVWRNWKLDASLFNGREPGENRWIIQPGPLDSYSGRLTYNPTDDWSMQVSMGHLTAPEALMPNDAVRTTASITYNRPWQDGNWATTLLWGHNRELVAAPYDLNGFLVESALDVADVNHVYTRAELTDKEGLVAGVGPQTVAAFTVGAVRDLWKSDQLSLGLGGDVTVDAVPPALQAAYGGAAPVSFEVYVRLAPPWMNMAAGGR